MTLQMRCDSRTMLEHKTPESNKSVPRRVFLGKVEPSFSTMGGALQALTHGGNTAWERERSSRVFKNLGTCLPG
jgi:hypothetical protein